MRLAVYLCDEPLKLRAVNQTARYIIFNCTCWKSYTHEWILHEATGEIALQVYASFFFFFAIPFPVYGVLILETSPTYTPHFLIRNTDSMFIHFFDDMEIQNYINKATKLTVYRAEGVGIAQ
jgi:hypothetical protein